MKNPFTDFKAKYASKIDFRSHILQGAIIITLIVLVVSIIWGVRSCSGNDYDFETPDDAISCYHEYLTKIQGIQSTDGKKFCEQVNEWQEVSDTIYLFLSHDPSFKENSPLYNRYFDIKDSIRYELVRLTETWKCSFDDIINIKEGTTRFRNDKELIETVNKATPFFVNLDNVSVPTVTKENSIQQYRLFLGLMKQRGIHSKEDMTDFIWKEDLIFRAFLPHIYELDDDHISDITHATEDICRNIFLEARRGKIDAKDALVYMSMRTVRRLLQNSAMCVKDISHRKMKSDIQANAYLWMIIQPFTSIDPLAIATLTPECRQTFKDIATQLPKSATFAKAFNIDQRALSYLLPQQLLKMYILTL